MNSDFDGNKCGLIKNSSLENFTFKRLDNDILMVRYLVIDNLYIIYDINIDTKLFVNSCFLGWCDTNIVIKNW